MSAQEITVKNILGYMIDATENKYMYFDFNMVGYCTICSIVRKLLGFPALVIFFTAFSMAENGYKRNLISFLYQHAQYSDCSKFSEISCTGMAIFAISLLLLMIFPSIRVILSESIE